MEESKTDLAIQAGATALVSRYLMGLDWKKSLLIGAAAVVTPILVQTVKNKMAGQATVFAPTGVIQ